MRLVFSIFSNFYEFVSLLSFSVIFMSTSHFYNISPFFECVSFLSFSAIFTSASHFYHLQHEGTQMTLTASIPSRWDFWFAVVESVLICRLRLQSCVIALTVDIWKNVVSFKNALFLPTAKRDLNLASLLDREDREVAPRKSSFPFAGIIKTKWHVLTQRVSATSPMQYFKKRAVEIRSLCLADSSSYHGKLRKACSWFEVWFAGRFVTPTSSY